MDEKTPSTSSSAIVTIVAIIAVAIVAFAGVQMLRAQMSTTDSDNEIVIPDDVDVDLNLSSVPTE